MTVGFYSPMPPQRTGVADYSAHLLSALTTRVPLRINQDGDINLYHLGNNQLHANIYRRALERPGVIVLHDAVLQHFALGYFDQSLYVEEFVYNYGEWTRAQAEQLWKNRARSAGDMRYFRHAMIRRVVERSKRVIVHNPGAAAIVREHYPAADIREIRHLYTPFANVHVQEVERFRAKLTRAPLFGVFGHLRESKRVLPILRTISRVEGASLLLAGEIASRDLRRAIEPWLRSPRVFRLEYMTPKDYWTAIQSVDACINLRYPLAGETSGVTISLMGAGKPVIMTLALENSRFPADACIQLDSGLAEQAQLEDTLRWLSADGLRAREIGARASAHIREFHDVSRVADLYREALDVN